MKRIFSFFLYHISAAARAFFRHRLIPGYELALRMPGTSIKYSSFARLTNLYRRSTYRARNIQQFLKRLGVSAFRKAGTCIELSESSCPQHHIPAAFFTDLIRYFFLKLHLFQLFGRFFHQRLKALIKSRQNFLPLHLGNCRQ